MGKNNHHIKISEEAVDVLVWARGKARIEFKKGLSKEVPKAYGDDIIWMYQKIQELSKILKTKLESEEDKDEK